MAAAAESRLLKPGGLTTTTVNSGQQWDAPNGWRRCSGWRSRGCKTMVSRRSPWRSRRFLTNVQHTYDSKQKLVEKYDVSSTGTGGGGGEYPLQDGFGWTNGVTLKMLDLICPQEKPCDALPATRPATTLHRRTNLLRRPRLTTPPCGTAKDRLLTLRRPLPKSVGEAVSPVTTVPCRPILRLAGNTSPRPRVEQVTFSLDRTNTNNNNSHYF